MVDKEVTGTQSLKESKLNNEIDLRKEDGLTPIENDWDCATTLSNQTMMFKTLLAHPKGLALEEVAWKGSKDTLERQTGGNAVDVPKYSAVDLTTEDTVKSKVDHSTLGNEETRGQELIVHSRKHCGGGRVLSDQHLFRHAIQVDNTNFEIRDGAGYDNDTIRKMMMVMRECGYKDRRRRKKA